MFVLKNKHLKMDLNKIIPKLETLDFLDKCL